ncbi:MAG TPA: sigma-70 family RNA polymerase sigma factor [Pedobacter sp.]
MGIKILDDESELLAKIVKGDERAFRIVFNTYQKKIYSSALQMLHDEILAEEVVQVSMLKLWMMGTGLLEIRNLQGYLIKISRNYAFDLLRRKEMQLKAERNIQVTWSEEHNETEEQILLNETRKILQDGIELLPPQQKIVYQLCHQEGLKYEEAASRLNLSVETIRSYMRLAQRFLRNHLRSNSDIAVLLIIFKLF